MTRFLGLLFRVSLLLYPRAFRVAYGREMRQAFEDGLREAALRNGRLAALGIALRYLSDVPFSSVREHWSAADRTAAALWLIAVPLGLFVGYVDSRNNEVQAAVLLIGVFSFLFGLVVPRRAWRWALAVGGSIPAYYLGGQILGVHLPPMEPNDWASLIALVPALLGAYAGSFVRWMGAEVAR